MGITGKLSTMSLAEVFQWLHTGQKTGTLHLENAEGIKKEVYFQLGVISSASSNDPEEALGQFMLNTQHINEEQLNQALESQKKDHDLLGKILVQQKILTAEALIDLLRTVSEEIIYDLFMWKEGNFEFMDDTLPKREMPSLQLDITALSLEGAQREDEWKRIREAFPEEGAIVRPVIHKILDKIPLEPEVTALLARVDGFHALAEICEAHRDTRYNIFKMLLELWEGGVIEVGGFEAFTLRPPSRITRISLDERLQKVQQCLKEGRLGDAEKALRDIEREGATHPDIDKYKNEVKEKRLRETAIQIINPNSVPILKMTVDAITKMDLSPEQGFLVSRINGVWDVKSIVRISPFGEEVCLDLLNQFLNDGVIGLK